MMVFGVGDGCGGSNDSSDCLVQLLVVGGDRGTWCGDSGW